MISLFERNCLKVTDLGKHQELCSLYRIMSPHMVQERLCNLKITKYEMWNKLDLYKSTIMIFRKDQKSGADDAQDVSVKHEWKIKWLTI